MQHNFPNDPRVTLVYCTKRREMNRNSSVNTRHCRQLDMAIVKLLSESCFEKAIFLQLCVKSGIRQPMFLQRVQCKGKPFIPNNKYLDN